MTTLARATIIISIGNFANFLINAAKSIVIAKYFGTGKELDSFFIAYIPFMILNGILVSSMQYTIIPKLVELSGKGKGEQASMMFRSFFSFSLLLFFSLSILLFGFSEFFIRLLAPGFAIEKNRIASQLLEIMAPTIFISGASEIINSRFHSEKNFWPPILGNVVNITVSFVYLLVFSRQGIWALAYGMVLGSCAQLGFSVLSAHRKRIPLGLLFRFRHLGLSTVFRNMVPMFLSVLFANINLAVDQMMASSLTGGSISALNYANNMIGIVQQIFIYSVGSAILPFLSHQVATGKFEELKITFRLGIRMAFFILFPITIHVLILGEPVIALLFQRGAFESHSTVAVANALKAFSFGLVALSVGILGVRILTVFQLTKTLVYISFGNIFINVILNWILMKYYGHVGIALSTSLSYLFSCLFILVATSRTIGAFDLKDVLIPLRKIVSWSIISGLVSLSYFFFRWGRYEHVGLLFVGGAAVFVYFLLAWKGNSTELKIILENLNYKKVLPFDA